MHSPHAPSRSRRSSALVAALVVPLALPLGLVVTPAAQAAGPTCDGTRATLVGPAGRDVLVGTRGNDVIVGLGGNDRIRGGGGNDVICGGTGMDRIGGGSGNDRLFGGEDRDQLRGGDGHDLLKGGPQVDRLYGGRGNDRLNAQAHGRLHNWWASRQTLSGGAGNDVLDLTVPNRPAVLEFAGSADMQVNLTTGIVTGQGRDRILLPPRNLWVEVRTGTGDDLITGGKEVRQLRVYANRGNDVVRNVTGHVTIWDTFQADRRDTDRYDLRGARSSAAILQSGSDTYLGTPGFDEVETSDDGSAGVVSLGKGPARVVARAIPHAPVTMARGNYAFEGAPGLPNTLDASTGTVTVGGRTARVTGATTWSMYSFSPVRFLGTEGPDVLFGMAGSLQAELRGGDDIVRDLLVDDPQSATHIDGGSGTDRLLRAGSRDTRGERPLRGVCTEVESGC